MNAEVKEILDVGWKVLLGVGSFIGIGFLGRKGVVVIAREEISAERAHIIDTVGQMLTQREQSWMRTASRLEAAVTAEASQLRRELSLERDDRVQGREEIHERQDEMLSEVRDLRGIVAALVAGIERIKGKLGVE